MNKPDTAAQSSAQQDTSAASHPATPPRIRTRHGLGYWARPIFLHGGLIVICFLMLYPIISTMLLSVKHPDDVRRKPPVLVPCDTPTAAFDPTACRFSVDGYRRVMLPQPNDARPWGFSITGRLLTQYMPNTLIYATGAAIFTTIFAGMAAYVVSRYRFRGRTTFLVMILALAGVPLLTMLLALYRMNIQLRGIIPGYSERIFMIVAYVGFELPFAIWLVKGFFDTIPRELEEAAKLDGASPIGALARIVAPLAAPGLASIFLLTYVNIWNEFIANYILMSRATLRGAMYGVYEYIAQSLTSYNALASACILIALPVILVFLLTRNIFFRSMVEGALKG